MVLSGVVCSLQALFSCFVPFVVILLFLWILSSIVYVLLGKRVLLALCSFGLWLVYSLSCFVCFPIGGIGNFIVCDCGCVWPSSSTIFFRQALLFEAALLIEKLKLIQSIYDKLKTVLLCF